MYYLVCHIASVFFFVYSLRNNYNCQIQHTRCVIKSNFSLDCCIYSLKSHVITIYITMLYFFVFSYFSMIDFFLFSFHTSCFFSLLAFSSIYLYLTISQEILFIDHQSPLFLRVVNLNAPKKVSRALIDCIS